MSNNDWVQQGTPRDGEWAAEDDYGVPVEPEEWDDYASEQTVAVPPAPSSEPEAEPEAEAEAEPEPEATVTAAEESSEVESAGDEPPVADERTPDEEPDSPAVDEWGPAVDATEEPGEDVSEENETTDIPEADTDTTEDQDGIDPDTAAVLATAGTGAGMAGLYRGVGSTEDPQPVIEQTQVIDDSQETRLAAEVAEEERIAQQVKSEQEARDQRLGVVPRSEANAVREPVTAKRGVGHFASFGLFVLRLVTAAIIGVVGYQILSDIDATTEFLSQTRIPEPETVSWVLGFGLAGMAVLLVIGLAVRVVGTLLAAVAGGSLAFIRWGSFSPFVEGMEGFLGDLDLLLAAVGILFLTIGGGRWGIDGAFAKARENARESRQ